MPCVRGVALIAPAAAFGSAPDLGVVEVEVLVEEGDNVRSFRPVWNELLAGQFPLALFGRRLWRAICASLLACRGWVGGGERQGKKSGGGDIGSRADGERRKRRGQHSGCACRMRERGR